MDHHQVILITGGSGLVGTALLRFLNQQGYEQIITPRSREYDLSSWHQTQALFHQMRPDYVFHSLRKGFATQLENAGVPHNVAARLMGHEHSDMTFGGYSDGLMFERLKEAITNVDYSKQH